MIIPRSRISTGTSWAYRAVANGRRCCIAPTVSSIQVRKQISGRRISRLYLSLFPSLFPSLATLLPRLVPPFPSRLRRSLAPVTRGLRRWDLPFEPSSIIEPDTEPRTEASIRSLIHLLRPPSLPISLAFYLSLALSLSLSHPHRRAPRLLHVGCLAAHPRHELATLMSRLLQNHTCARHRTALSTCPRSPTRSLHPALALCHAVYLPETFRVGVSFKRLTRR